MAGRVELSVLLLLIVAAPSTRGLLLTNEDSPSLLDRVLQVVWEPSSLIRMWVGLDQLYNIALSWKGVAKSLASLPFGEGRSESHVMIQQPRSLKYHKPSVASQWDRFNEIYASSSLSPILSHVHNRPAFTRGGNLLPLSNYRHIFFEENLRVPASTLTQQELSFNADDHRKSIGSLQTHEQNVFPGDSVLSSSSVVSQSQGLFLGSLKSSNELHHIPPFGNTRDSLLDSKLLYFQNQKSLQRPGGVVEEFGAALDSSQQKRLTAFLRLLRTLGKIHAKEVSRDSSETTDP